MAGPRWCGEAPCPSIATGSGRVVTATITHQNDDVRTLTMDGGETLYVTGNHRMYSASAQDWVPVRQLHLGEELRTPEGRRSVASLGYQKGRHDVYNLEVEAEHCYFVGEGGALAHNVCKGSGETSATAEGRAAHKNYGTALGAGYDVEVTLDSGKRADAVDWDKKEVRELKPDNPRAIAGGQKQVEAYKSELEKMTGQKGQWTAHVDTYQSSRNKMGNGSLSARKPAASTSRKTRTKR